MSPARDGRARLGIDKPASGLTGPPRDGSRDGRSLGGGRGLAGVELVEDLLVDPLQHLAREGPGICVLGFSIRSY